MTRGIITKILGGGLAIWLAGTAAAAERLVIRNATLELEYQTKTGVFTLKTRPAGQVALDDARLAPGAGFARVRTIAHPQLGSGQAIEVTQADGRQDTAMVFREVPFVLFRTGLRNSSNAPVVIRQVETFSGRVAGEAVADLRTLGTGGLLAPEKNQGSYVWLATVNPKTRAGLVGGWLTHERGSGVVFSPVAKEAVRLEARLDYGRLRLAPGQVEQLESFALGHFADARLGLEAWADLVAKVNRIHLRPQPAGYCTWYSRPNGGASSETAIAELSSFASTNLRSHGFSVVQIDDGWQAGISTNGPKRDFSTHRAKGPFPGGMQVTAERIKAYGLVPGIWFMPFAGTYYDPVFREHPDWFVKTTNGAPFETAWGGTCLDMTHPGARGWLSNNIHRTAHEWGYQYFKMDGLWTGTGTRQQYVNTGFKEDGIGNAVFANPDKCNLEAYRDGLRLVRAVAGPEVFFLGCCAPQNMRSYGGAFGLVDAMRIGPDNGAEWNGLLRGPVFGSRHYFLHGRVWYNDPDPVYVRASIPLKHAQLICSWVAVSGQLNLSSEWLPGLPPERLDVLKHTLASHGATARPVDLFENDPPRIWTLSQERDGAHRNIAGLFNWTERELELEVPLTDLGLDAKPAYAAFDYWGSELLPPVQGRLRVSVPAQACRIIALREIADRPLLLSTSAHVTQGIADGAVERWDRSAKMLTGTTRLVGGELVELRLLAAPGWTLAGFDVAASDRAAGTTVSLDKAKDGLVRVQLTSPASRTVGWAARYRKGL